MSETRSAVRSSPSIHRYTDHGRGNAGLGSPRGSLAAGNSTLFGAPDPASSRGAPPPGAHGERAAGVGVRGVAPRACPSWRVVPDGSPNFFGRDEGRASPPSTAGPDTEAQL